MLFSILFLRIGFDGLCCTHYRNIIPKSTRREYFQVFWLLDVWWMVWFECVKFVDKIYWIQSFLGPKLRIGFWKTFDKYNFGISEENAEQQFNIPKSKTLYISRHTNAHNTLTLLAHLLVGWCGWKVKFINNKKPVFMIFKSDLVSLIARHTSLELM